MIKQTAATVTVLVCLVACGDGSDSIIRNAAPVYDLGTVDAAMRDLVATAPPLDGISYVTVDREQGVIHEAAFGDHDLDIVVLLASTSKMPVASLLMAVTEDPAVDYDVEATVADYLPWMGVYGDRTSVQMVSNTSGIPGLRLLNDYGVHQCQYLPLGSLEQCGQLIDQNLLPDTQPAGTVFDYGGSQWQLAGTALEQAANATWNQLFDEYIAGPCELDVFTFGNPWANLGAWNGSPDSLIGLDNPNIEGGAISNMSDYSKILLMHLREGRCGNEQVLSPEAVDFMREDRGGEFGTPYGMGWWILPDAAGGNSAVYYDPGFFGAVSWIDAERGIGGYVAVDDYSSDSAAFSVSFVLQQVIPLTQRAVDEARAAVQ